MKPNKLKIEFICGTTFDRNGDLIESSTIEAACRTAQALLLSTFGGFSQLTVTGAWRSPDSGRVAHDATIVYTVLADHVAANVITLDEIQSTLAESFRQESVPYVVTEVFCKF